MKLVCSSALLCTLVCAVSKRKKSTSYVIRVWDLCSHLAGQNNAFVLKVLTITQAGGKALIYSPALFLTLIFFHRSHNHRMAWVGRGLKGTVVPAPLVWAGTLCCSNSIQPGLKDFRGWDIHSFSGYIIYIYIYISIYRYRYIDISTAKQKSNT